MDILSEILYNHTLPNSFLLKTEYFIALIARIKLYVLCGLFSCLKKFLNFFGFNLANHTCRSLYGAERGIWSYVKKKYKLNTTNFLFLCNC